MDSSVFRRKTKSGFCVCAITFQSQSTFLVSRQRVLVSTLPKFLHYFCAQKGSTQLFFLNISSRVRSMVPSPSFWGVTYLVSFQQPKLSRGAFSPGAKRPLHHSDCSFQSSAKSIESVEPEEVQAP
jgi:hypothetical protein